MKKKFLFLNVNDSTSFGGREVYNKNIISLLKNNFDVEISEFSFNFEPNKEKIEKNINKQNIYIVPNNKSVKSSPFLSNKQINKSYYLLKKIIDDYDYIIISNYFLKNKFKKIIPKNKSIWIQHNDCDFYSLNYFRFFNKLMLSKFIFLFFSKILKFLPTFYFCDTHIYYTEQDKIKFKSRFKNISYKNYFLIVNSDIYPKQKDIKLLSQKKKELLYFSRIDQTQKNISFIYKLSKYLNYKINIYGNTIDDCVPQNKMLKAHGLVKNCDKEKIYDTYFFTILLPFFDGIPFALSNSISYNTPLITCNTFVNSFFLTDNNKNGLNINVEKIGFKPKKIAKIINEYLDSFITNDNLNNKYFDYCKNNYEFSKKNINIEIFQEKWINFYKKILSIK